jgi:hypothetical protein
MAAAAIIAFCSFSNARTSISRTRSREPDRPGRRHGRFRVATS